MTSVAWLNPDTDDIEAAIRGNSENDDPIDMAPSTQPPYRTNPAAHRAAHDRRITHDNPLPRC